MMKEVLKNNPKVEEILLQVADVAGYLWQNGWAERNAGNISVNISELIDSEWDENNGYPVSEMQAHYPELAGKYFLITGTGKRMRDLACKPLENAGIIKITANGRGYHSITNSIYDPQELMPTSELPSHLGIHRLIARRRSNEKVIIHTHANELIALTHSPEMKSPVSINKTIWGMHPEAMLFVPKGVGFVPYMLPGSTRIADETLDELQNHDIVLWEKHGVFAIGDRVHDTYDTIDIVAKSAKIWLACKSAGFEPEGLTDEQLQELKDNYGCNSQNP